LSREALAYHSGLSGAAIAQIESGRRQDVRLASLVALSSALSVSVDYLVGASLAAAPTILQHCALIYQSDDEYLAAAVPFLREGVARNESPIAIAVRRHTRQLRKALGDDAHRVVFHDPNSWYKAPATTLGAFQTYVKERVEGGSRWIRVIAEPVWIGRSEVEVAAWARYESIINLSMASFPATIVCPYDTRALPETVVATARHTHPDNPAYIQPEEFLLGIP
jgi:transcriptional regulator with XRE-family HTH domain